MATPKFRLEVSYNEATGDPVAAYVRVREGKAALKFMMPRQSVSLLRLEW